jgi:hypothetical protein
VERSGTLGKRQKKSQEPQRGDTFSMITATDWAKVSDIRLKPNVTYFRGCRCRLQYGAPKPRRGDQRLAQGGAKRNPGKTSKKITGTPEG